MAQVNMDAKIKYHIKRQVVIVSQQYAKISVNLNWSHANHGSMSSLELYLYYEHIPSLIFE